MPNAEAASVTPSGRTGRCAGKQGRRGERRRRDSPQRLAQAAELGVSLPRLLVEAALEGRQTPAGRREEIAALFEIRRLLATVANNVNQLARSANISG